jgi:hypothetical protein
MKPFRIGINMAGAISAGAYTAGVFDFLIEAIQQWEAAKAQNQIVPRHSVSIEVLSGASAGGMCSGMGALSLYDESTTQPNPTRLYGAWVQDIDISDLLKTEDLKNDVPVVSALDCTALEKIADKRLSWQGTPERPSFVSSNLTLFLSLTNLRGTPYSVDFANGGSFEERISYHADQIQFEVLEPGTPARSEIAYQVPTNDMAAEGWTQLKAAALATGAFPIGLAARTVRRKKEEYQFKQWQISVPPQKDGQGNCICETDRQIPPAWGYPNVMSPFDTVNADGGVTNNNPFECARRYLASLDGNTHNARGATDADRAVLTIAPFPGDEHFTNQYDTAKERSLFGMLPNLLSALISQSRFQGEALSLLKDESVFSRFVIAPDDDHVAPPIRALQCGALGAFGGFLYKGFRDRDYRLGRRNCQRFLKEHFALAVENPLIEDGLGANKQALIDQFSATTPSPAGVRTTAWMPIIPLCGTAAVPIPYPERQKLPISELDEIVSSAVNRLSDVSAQLAKGNGFLAWLFGWEVRVAIKTKGKSLLKTKILDELQRELSI